MFNQSKTPQITWGANVEIQHWLGVSVPASQIDLYLSKDIYRQSRLYKIQVT